MLQMQGVMLMPNAQDVPISVVQEVLFMPQNRGSRSCFDIGVLLLVSLLQGSMLLRIAHTDC